MITVPNIKTQEFIRQHLNDDVHDLALHAQSHNDIDISFALRQISGYQKIKHKIPYFYQQPDIFFPVQLSLEQSSSELTARYKASLFSGDKMADLTGGFGIDCFFMAQNFKTAWYFERNHELCEIASHNFKILQANHIIVTEGNSTDFQNTTGPLDLIYIDPARRDQSGKKVVSVSDCEPDVSLLLNNFKAVANHILIKLSPMLDITQALRALPGASCVHIISVANECKEILIEINQDTPNDSIQYKALNLNESTESAFDFVATEEENAHVEYTDIIFKYLYEPNAAIMKAGAFKLISSRFGLKKLHPNTHLYTSDQLLNNFPGRVFHVLQTLGTSKQDIKSIKTSISKANIAVRNFPLSVDELRKKTAIKDGGDDYLFACKTHNEKNVIVWGRK